MFCRQFVKLMLFPLIMASILGTDSAQTPQLKLRSVDGGVIDLAKEHGRVVVLSFSTTWSPTASRSLPAFQRLSDYFIGQGVSFYWVSINNARAGETNYVSDEDTQKLCTKAWLASQSTARPGKRNISLLTTVCYSHSVDS